MNTKTIEIIRGGQSKPLVTTEGDQYDSTLNLRSPDGKTIYSIPYVNTDMSVRYRDKAGILAEGTYAFLRTNTNKLGNCFLIFPYANYDKINNLQDAEPNLVTLPSLIPNPNHADFTTLAWLPIMDYVYLHKGGSISWDWSAGCITTPDKYYTKLMSYFALNDKGLLILRRQEGWVAPSWYQNK